MLPPTHVTTVPLARELAARWFLFSKKKTFPPPSTMTAAKGPCKPLRNATPTGGGGDGERGGGEGGDTGGGEAPEAVAMKSRQKARARSVPPRRRRGGMSRRDQRTKRAGSRLVPALHPPTCFQSSSDADTKQAARRREACALRKPHSQAFRNDLHFASKQRGHRCGSSKHVHAAAQEQLSSIRPIRVLVDSI